MIDRSDLRCPVCRSLSLTQGTQTKCGGRLTTRREREDNGLVIDNIQTLECRPNDPTWYRCIMCNSEFDGDGQVYATRKMWPFEEQE